MTSRLDRFLQLTDAEDYFLFFDLPYDRQVVSINRLHILKLFAQYIAEMESCRDKTTEEDKLLGYRDALQRAYDRFLTATAQETKLFKVFNEKPKNLVLLSEIHAS
jgi:nitrogenase-stabilizing/protective protein